MPRCELFPDKLTKSTPMFDCVAVKLASVAVTDCLAGRCVTTETGGFEDKKDPQKAVEFSVQAARSYIQEGNWEAAKRHLKNALEIDDTMRRQVHGLARYSGEPASTSKPISIFVRRSIALG